MLMATKLGRTVISTHDFTQYYDHVFLQCHVTN